MSVAETLPSSTRRIGPNPREPTTRRSMIAAGGLGRQGLAHVPLQQRPADLYPLRGQRAGAVERLSRLRLQRFADRFLRLGRHPAAERELERLDDGGRVQPSAARLGDRRRRRHRGLGLRAPVEPDADLAQPHLVAPVKAGGRDGDSARRAVHDLRGDASGQHLPLRGRAGGAQHDEVRVVPLGELVQRSRRRATGDDLLGDRDVATGRRAPPPPPRARHARGGRSRSRVGRQGRRDVVERVDEGQPCTGAPGQRQRQRRSVAGVVGAVVTDDDVAVHQRL